MVASDSSCTDLLLFAQDGWTPLHIVARAGDLKLCQQLVAAGADILARSTKVRISGCRFVAIARAELFGMPVPPYVYARRNRFTSNQYRLAAVLAAKA